MSTILNSDEAVAVYSAMTALRSIGGRLRATLRDGKSIHETCNGWILVEQLHRVDPQEKFRNHTEFAIFYKL